MRQGGGDDDALFLSAAERRERTIGKRAGAGRRECVVRNRDISGTFDLKMKAIRCYASQFDGAKAAGEIHPTGQDLYELIRVQAAHYGSLIRRPYGEPYYTPETMEVDDVLALGVQSL